MTLHVLFTKDGIPGWIGQEPCDGSEPVEGLTVDFLAAHRRGARGKWVPRDPVVPVPPTPEELAAQREADYQLALELRSAALRDVLSREADPIFFQWQRGEATQADWLEKVASIKAAFPKPEAP
ncbi:MAG: hypothetical protein JNK19_16475 [Tabrizicola sp.]|nr:hypothetical protein [Tabrizicola sp.]